MVLSKEGLTVPAKETDEILSHKNGKSIYSGVAQLVEAGIC